MESHPAAFCREALGQYSWPRPLVITGQEDTSLTHDKLILSLPPKGGWAKAAQIMLLSQDAFEHDKGQKSAISDVEKVA